MKKKFFQVKCKKMFDDFFNSTTKVVDCGLVNESQFQKTSVKLNNHSIKSLISEKNDQKKKKFYFFIHFLFNFLFPYSKKFHFLKKMIKKFFLQLKY